MVVTSGSGDIIENVTYTPTSNKLISFSRRMLKQFGSSSNLIESGRYSFGSAQIIEYATYVTILLEEKRSIEPI